MKKIIIIIAGFIMSISAFAQQDPQFTMYMFNKQVLNPAYAGSRETFSMTALYRNQWVGWGEGKPQTMNIGFHTPIDGKTDFKRVAVGLYAFNDNLGVSNTFGLNGQYAYRIPISSKDVLSMGVQAGFVNYRSALTETSPIDPGDPILQSDVINSFMPNLGLGIYLYSEKYYIGISAPRLMQNQYNSEEIPTAGDLVAKQYRHYYAMAGYVFDLSENVKLKPNVLLKQVGSGNIAAPFDADFNLSVYFYERVMFGASYRLDDSVDGIVEFQITNNLRAGYAYDYTLSKIGNFNSGSHEIMIGYDLGKKVQSFTTPRFIRYF